jgi:hypothetical protein
MRIEIRFKGGFRDGTTLSGDTDDPSSAAAYPFLTNGAGIGKRVSEMPPETRNELYCFICPNEKAGDFIKRAEELVSRIANSELTNDEVAAAIETVVRQNESEFPMHLNHIPFSRFKNVIYEIKSREIRDDCIYAIAEYIGVDDKTILNDWPPNLNER